MKYFSMFSGIGGFELGIKEKGECIGFSEIDKYAIQTYQRHFPNHKNYGNATDINANELPDFDMLCGGFPCQAFSIAGKRLGFQDTRGTLFFEIARIVKAKTPMILLLENVKGLLSHNEGETFRVITKTLNSLGYFVDFRILNSKHFGVPQNRERIFIYGVNIKCLKEFVKDGTKKKKNLSEKTIKSYLSEKLLTLYNEHPKPQELKLKDLDLTSILLKEIIGTGLLKKSEYSRKILNLLIPNLQKYCATEQQLLSATKEKSWELAENDPIGITLKKDILKDEMEMEVGLENIEKLLKECWEESSNDLREFTTLMVEKAIIPNRTYTYAEIILITNLFIVAWKESLLNWWKQVSSNLIEVKGVMLDDSAHKFFMGNRRDSGRCFFGRCFRGTSSRQVFPLRQSSQEDNGERGTYSYAIDASYYKGAGNKKQRTMVQVHNMQPRSADRPSIKKNPNSGGSGHLSRDDISYCLDSGSTNAVEFHNNRIRRLTPIECEFLQSFPKDWTKYGIETFINIETYYKVYGKSKKTDTNKILQELWETIGKEKRKRRGLTELIALLKKEILQPRMYETELQTEIQRGCFGTTRQLQSKAIDYCNRMFSLWKERESRYPPQRQEQIKQLFRKLTSSLQKLPHKITQEKGQLEQRKSQESSKNRERKIYVITEISDTQRYKQ